jgi:hypothetical protein
MNLKLHINVPEVAIRIVDLTTATLPCVIGRDSEVSQVAIADSQASRAHCSIEL